MSAIETNIVPTFEYFFLTEIPEETLGDDEKLRWSVEGVTTNHEGFQSNLLRSRKKDRKLKVRYQIVEGGGGNGFGVTLVNGTSTTSGDSMTLISGSRTWRFRVSSVQESADDILLLEVKHGTTWYPAQQFVVTDFLGS